MPSSSGTGMPPVLHETPSSNGTKMRPLTHTRAAHSDDAPLSPCEYSPLHSLHSIETADSSAPGGSVTFDLRGQKVSHAQWILKAPHCQVTGWRIGGRSRESTPWFAGST